ncbi:hypothetical protein [Caldalkalibacillus salinus]|uniref:hypothetical protein n=1 Tax=Caldalkalibacillus salinus TaxID=2803787 RepID=UPI0019221FA3|nr:hypothetical protein [Caldalkalibacillus salinus]
MWTFVLQHPWLQTILLSLVLVLIYMTLAVIGSRRGWFVWIFKIAMSFLQKRKKRKAKSTQSP